MTANQLAEHPASSNVPAVPALPGPGSSRWQRAAPVVTLLLLSPVLAEVHFGVIRVTTLFALIPAIGAWGCGALILRALVRRRRLGWPALFLLGLALALAEECVIQQTSLAPLPGADVEQPYCREFGVNWVYFLWAIGYESIWAVVLPVRLTELIFPAQQHEPWLGKRGLLISATVFALASFVAWYTWTQLFLPQFFLELAYQVPLPAIGLAVAAIVALGAAAFHLCSPATPRSSTVRAAPRPAVVGLVAFVLGIPWFCLILLAYGIAPWLPPVLPLVGGLLLAGFALLLIQRWSASADWHDRHDLALISGALGASMVAGFVILKLSHAPAIDFIGKLIVNAAAVWLLVNLNNRR